MAEGGTHTSSSWEEKAANMQQNLAKFFGGYAWDEYLLSERKYLEKKVGFALYGPPFELPITEIITSWIVGGDRKKFLHFLGEDDWASFRSSARGFVETLIGSTLFTSRAEVPNYEKLKEYDVIDMVCSAILEGNKPKFLNYFSECDWELFQKSLNDFVEQQVTDALFGFGGKQTQYTKRQNEIISRVCDIVMNGDVQKFCLLLSENEWYSQQNVLSEVLSKKVGKSLFGLKLFRYNDKQNEMIKKVCSAVLNGEKKTFLNFLGESDWDELRKIMDELLRKNIPNPLFGSPGLLPSKKNTNQTGYTMKQYENIQKICSVIVREDKHRKGKNEETFMSIIFVCLKVLGDGSQSSDVLPVTIFRVPGDSDTSSFIDSNGRVYKNWDDFLKNNELPKCRYCYPRNGVYPTEPEDLNFIEFGETPACKLSKKFLTALDLTNTGVVLGATTVTVASLFLPIAAPLVAISVWGGGAAGVYGVARSSGTLVDRAQHNQEMGLEDSEARSCWINLAASALGMASMGATTALTRMTQAGQVVGTTGRITTTVLNFGSLVVNGLGVVHGAFMLHSKYKEGDLTPLDVFQFSASVLFFTHSAINIKTASTIIQETQTEVLQKYEAGLRSNRHRKMFKKIARNTQKDMDVVEGRAKVIRSLRKIENKDDFFAGLVRSDKDFRKTGSKVKFTETGHVEINTKLTIDPMKFAQINKEQRQIILKATQNLASGNLSQQEFQNTTDTIFSRLNISLTPQERNDYISSIDTMMNGNNFTGLSSDGQRVMRLVVDNLNEMANVYKILTNIDKKLHLRILEVAAYLSEILGWRTESYFVGVLAFVCRTVYDIASRMEQKYQDDLSFAQWESGTEFDQDLFDRNYNISGRRFDHFCSVVLEQFISDRLILESLKTAFNLENNVYNGMDNGREETADKNKSLSVVDDAQTNVEFEQSYSCAESSPVAVEGTGEPLQYTNQQPLVRSRPFWVDGDLNVLREDEIFDIVQEVSGCLVDHTNCFIDYEAVNVNVTVIASEGHALFVVISCNIDEGTLTAHASNVQ